MTRLISFVIAIFAIGGCGNGSIDASDTEVAVSANAPEVRFTPGAKSAHTVKGQMPVTIDYTIIGTPIVGQPVGIDLQVKSNIGPQPVTLSYRVNDTTAMQFTEAQPARVSIAASKDESPSLQQVRVIPMREGRLFLNVSATIESESGSISTVTAIPIQVGATPRETQQNGEVTRDESGELIHSLPAAEN